MRGFWGLVLCRRPSQCRMRDVESLIRGCCGASLGGKFVLVTVSGIVEGELVRMCLEMECFCS